MLNIATVIALIQQYAPGIDPESIESAVSDWLDDHPEATTTVEDGSITEEKLAADLALTLSTLESDVSDVKNAIQGLGLTVNNSGELCVSFEQEDDEE